MKPATSDVTVMMNKLMAKLDAIAPKVGIKHLALEVRGVPHRDSGTGMEMRFSPEITDAKTHEWAVQQLTSILEDFESENGVRVGEISVTLIPNGTGYAVPQCGFWDAD